jgi:hypothetical protein
MRIAMSPSFQSEDLMHLEAAKVDVFGFAGRYAFDHLLMDELRNLIGK